MGERFFNIWYLMRNASRRQRNRLRWLTEFLRRLYSSQQIPEMADDDAEQAYRKAIELGGDDTLFSRTNLAYLLLSQTARAEEAETVYADAVALLPEHGRQILTAFRAIAKDNFGEAKEILAQALEQNHPELYTVYYDDLMRFLRLAKARGYGERLIAHLQESGLGERHWPLYAAFDAYLHGEEKLRDVNLEVRGAAQRIFDWLNASADTAQKDTSGIKKKGRKTTRKQ
jgi:hypothetical protein